MMSLFQFLLKFYLPHFWSSNHTKSLMWHVQNYGPIQSLFNIKKQHILQDLIHELIKFFEMGPGKYV